MSRRMYVVVIFILWVGVVLTVPASAETATPIRGGVSSPSVTLDGGAVIAGRMARAVRKTQRAERIKKQAVQRAKRRAVHRASVSTAMP